MDFIIKVAFVLIMFCYLWLYQEENQAWDLTRNNLKYANNFAAHDAGQEIIEADKSSGQIRIDRNRASQTFQSTLRLNLGLDMDLKPLPGSPVRSPVRIVYFEVVDDTSTINGIPVVFPYLYENSTYKIAKWLHGPAVVSVIETNHPQFIAGTAKAPVRVPTIYEYKTP